MNVASHLLNGPERNKLVPLGQQTGRRMSEHSAIDEADGLVFGVAANRAAAVRTAGSRQNSWTGRQKQVRETGDARCKDKN